jgi:hypothetical protein
VRCGPLSDFLDEREFGACNLLKIDTQGSELDVLRGAAELLARFQAVYCEVSFLELYAGQALASEVVAYLFERGFELSGIYNLQSSPTLGLLQADMLFTRGVVAARVAGL